MLDIEGNGYLLQIFSKTLQLKPTFFIESIQRKNSEGFGFSNIKALYDSIGIEKDRDVRQANDY
ncbi:hypothetical protein [Orientia tsutsugamushi]|uniref:hypothetical protein n=1 Tax=Orientia tsutsugamushi TaxID=784 RepID=UPI000D5A32E9|nr:4-hydroxyphenylpyruvate dioxygenase [Orientia tsutsugamushi]